MHLELTPVIEVKYHYQCYAEHTCVMERVWIFELFLGCVHKLSPGNPGYEPAVHKLITETSLIVYERLVFNRVRN